MAESSLSSRLPSEANPKSEAAGRPLGRKGPGERARTRLSKLIGGLLLVGAGLTESNWEPQHNTFATFLYALGLVIVSIATSGRIWCSFYLSGHKDSKLTTEGPFSLCRNPLYFFSSLGVIGIGLCTETLTIPVTFALIFAIYYPGIIAREEQRLLHIFGEAYQRYLQDVPRFFPSFRHFREPQTWNASPVLFRKHVINDTIFIWLAAVLELIEALREAGTVPHLLNLW
jgi:protein-S-isoprenylcysteine O-methyltransferase Ste14